VKGDSSMPRDPIGPPVFGPDYDARPDPPSRGVRPRISVLTRGWAAALAALVIGLGYLAGPPPIDPARRTALGEGAGPARALAFGPGGGLRVAPSGGTARLWEVDPGVGRAVPGNVALPGAVAALAPGGSVLAVGNASLVTLWDVAAGAPRAEIPTGAR